MVGRTYVLCLCASCVGEEVGEPRPPPPHPTPINSCPSADPARSREDQAGKQGEGAGGEGVGSGRAGIGCWPCGTRAVRCMDLLGLALGIGDWGCNQQPSSPVALCKRAWGALVVCLPGPVGELHPGERHALASALCRLDASVCCVDASACRVDASACCVDASACCMDASVCCAPSTLHRPRSRPRTRRAWRCWPPSQGWVGGRACMRMRVHACVLARR